MIKMKKIFCVICSKYRKFKNPKISYIFEKKKQPLISQTLVFLILTTSVKMKRNEYSKKKNELRY